MSGLRIASIPRRLARSSPLFRNASLLFLNSLLLSGMGFVFWVAAARRYSASDVGTSSAVISASILVSGVAQFGLGSILTRYLPSAGHRTGRTIIVSYVAASVTTLVLAICSVIVAGRWSSALHILLDDPWWSVIFIAGTVCWTIFSLQDSVLTGLRETHWLPPENAIYAASRLLLVVVVAAALPAKGIVVATLVPSALLIVPMTLIIFARFVPRAAASRGDAIPWSSADVRRLFVGNSIGNIASLVSVFLLPIVVADIVGATSAAYFYVAWTIGVSLALITSTIATSLVVEAAHDEARMAELTRQSLKAVLRIAIPIALLVALAARQVMSIFGGSYADNGATLLRMLALSAIPGAVATIGISISRVLHDGRRVATVQILVAIVGVGVAAALMPHYGINGVGIGWLLSQVVAAALVLPLVRDAVRSS
jgi:O-antigen/teichoic acid export membrane protein